MHQPQSTQSTSTKPGSTPLVTDPELIARNLRHAQDVAAQLFELVHQEGLLSPGRSEKEVSDAIFALARDTFGIEKHWHKRIVRTGENTLLHYSHNPPDRVIEEGDIVFYDFGPLLEDWEADYGRTVVLGDDPAKHAIARDIEPLFMQGKAYFHQQDSITGAELYAYVVDLCKANGWGFGNRHCGHLIGQFPHETRLGEKDLNYICAENNLDMKAPDESGEIRHWILELHLIDPTQSFGAFYEDLLTL